MTTARLTQSLGELFRVGSSRRVLQSQWQSKGVPFYRGREITQLAAEGYVNNALFISEDLYTDLAAKNGVPSAGDIMVTAIGTIGNSYIVQDSDRFYFKDASVLWLKKTSDVSTEFINWWLKSPLFFDQLDRGNGATVDTLTIQKLQAVAVDLPPLPAQQRIVTLLDEAFAGIAIAKANAEKNLQNARAIFESQLRSVFTQRDEGWVEKSLEELGTITSSKRIFKSEYVESGIPFYRTKEIKELANGRGITTELFISETRYNEIKAGFGVPKVGDILLTAIGTIGEIWVVDGEDDFYFKDGNVLWLKEFTSVNPQFLRYVLLSFVDNLNKMSHGSAYSALPIQRLNVHRIFLPSELVQEQIVITLDALYQATNRLASICRQKITVLDDLKKSLLHSAFDGKL